MARTRVIAILVRRRSLGIMAAFKATILQYEMIVRNRRRSLAVEMGETKVAVEFSAVYHHNQLHVSLRLVRVVGLWSLVYAFMKDRNYVDYPIFPFNPRSFTLCNLQF